MPTDPGGDETADVVIIGGGHNALVCAAYLAAAGLDVLVAEALPLLGGNTVTEELTLPGWQHDACASAHVVLQANPLIRDDELGLVSRHGLRYLRTDPAFVLPVGDDALVVRRDVEATADRLARWSASDATALRHLIAAWEGGLSGAHARFSAGLAPADDDADRAYEALRQRSAWDVVHTTFSHPVSRAMMSWLAFATFQPPQRPGTGALPAAIASGRLRHGWTTPVGGSGALPRALAAAIGAHGGRIITSAPVERILADGGRASGVRTSDGRRFTARRAVVSSAHLAQLPSMLDGSVPADLRRAARAWRPGLALFAVHVALRADVTFRTSAGPVAAVAGALGSPDGLRRQVIGCAQGRIELDDPWLLLVCSTVVDPDRAPDGGGILKLLTAAPSRLADGAAWDRAATDVYAQRLLERASEAVDGLAHRNRLAVRAESPVDLARRNPLNHGGSCHGGEFDLGEAGVLAGWPGYRTAVPGLYLTGSTTHPGGSVSGRPGRNTARCVLTDLGINPASLMPAP